MNQNADKKVPAKVDAISLLKADHAAVKELFSQFNALAEGSAAAHQKKGTIYIASHK